MVISITLVFSTFPPVSVLVRARAFSLEAFLGGMASGTRRLTASCHRTSGYGAPHLSCAPPTCLTQDYRRLGSHSLPRPPIGQMIATWYRNINLLSIDYAFRPRLRSRLTLSRRTFTQESLRNRWRGFSPLFRYSCRHSHFPGLHGWIPPPLHGHGNALLPRILRCTRSFGG